VSDSDRPTRADLDAEERQDRLEAWARRAAPHLASYIGVEAELADAADLACGLRPVIALGDGTVAVYVRLLIDSEDLP
jgi:hypothetical protein